MKEKNINIRLAKKEISMTKEATERLGLSQSQFYLLKAFGYVPVKYIERKPYKIKNKKTGKEYTQMRLTDKFEVVNPDEIPKKDGLIVLEEKKCYNCNQHKLIPEGLNVCENCMEKREIKSNEEWETE